MIDPRDEIYLTRLKRVIHAKVNFKFEDAPRKGRVARSHNHSIPKIHVISTRSRATIIGRILLEITQFLLNTTKGHFDLGVRILPLPAQSIFRVKVEMPNSPNNENENVWEVNTEYNVPVGNTGNVTVKHGQVNYLKYNAATPKKQKPVAYGKPPKNPKTPTSKIFKVAYGGKRKTRKHRRSSRKTIRRRN